MASKILGIAASLVTILGDTRRPRKDWSSAIAAAPSRSPGPFSPVRPRVIAQAAADGCRSVRAPHPLLARRRFPQFLEMTQLCVAALIPRTDYLGGGRVSTRLFR